ncbi:MAG: hypothetical protein BRD44_07975 [Bacteroidetes bacterium QS_7_67_15]|nr:MAG: hypothetical protein BRD44_07975 [Bacteroidetes bacterium QS_7_67_15]
MNGPTTSRNDADSSAACPYCPVGTLKPGTTTEVYERGGVTLVVKDIPAEVCWACGEAVTTEETVGRLEEMIAETERGGMGTGVRHFEPTTSASPAAA